MQSVCQIGHIRGIREFIKADYAAMRVLCEHIVYEIAAYKARAARNQIVHNFKFTRIYS